MIIDSIPLLLSDEMSQGGKQQPLMRLGYRRETHGKWWGGVIPVSLSAPVLPPTGSLQTDVIGYCTSYVTLPWGSFKNAIPRCSITTN